MFGYLGNEINLVTCIKTLCFVMKYSETYDREMKPLYYVPYENTITALKVHQTLRQSKSFPHNIVYKIMQVEIKQAKSVLESCTTRNDIKDLRNEAN